MFDFLKPKKDPIQEQSPLQIIAPIRNFTLNEYPGSAVPVDEYIVLYASLLKNYEAGQYFYKLFEWRLYKSPHISWVNTPVENLRLYVNDEQSYTDKTGLSIAKKEKKN